MSPKPPVGVPVRAPPLWMRLCCQLWLVERRGWAVCVVLFDKIVTPNFIQNSVRLILPYFIITLIGRGLCNIAGFNVHNHFIQTWQDVTGKNDAVFGTCNELESYYLIEKKCFLFFIKLKPQMDFKVELKRLSDYLIPHIYVFPVQTAKQRNVVLTSPN